MFNRINKPNSYYIDSIAISCVKRIRMWRKQHLDVTQTGNFKFFWFFLNDFTVIQTNEIKMQMYTQKKYKKQLRTDETHSID